MEMFKLLLTPSSGNLYTTWGQRARYLFLKTGVVLVMDCSRSLDYNFSCVIQFKITRCPWYIISADGPAICGAGPPGYLLSPVCPRPVAAFTENTLKRPDHFFLPLFFMAGRAAAFPMTPAVIVPPFKKITFRKQNLFHNQLLQPKDWGRSLPPTAFWFSGLLYLFTAKFLLCRCTARN
jgi:hypothetical protein